MHNFFNKFKNVMTQIPQSQQVIPAKKDEKSSEKEETHLMNLNQRKMKF